MGFLRRWLSQSLSTALALLCGLFAMQAPGFTRDYAGALLQIAADARRDIEQREASARQFYGIAAASDDALIAALRTHEPSNADMIERSLDRARRLQQAYDAIEGSPSLLRPLIALRNAIGAEGADKEPIWTLSLRTYSAQIDLSLAAAIYGLGGVMLGSLLGQALAQLIALPFRQSDDGRRRSRR
jgi:hypothetical protein